MTLFEIESDLKAIDALLDDSGGEIAANDEAVYDAWFAEAQANLGAKLDGYVGLWKHWEAMQAKAEEVADQFKAKAMAFGKAIERHKNRLMAFMKRSNVTKLATAKGWNISIVNNGGKLPLKIIGTPQELPAEYRKEIQVIETKADTEKIREKLESGETLPFAYLEPRGQRLTVK